MLIVYSLEVFLCLQKSSGSCVRREPVAWTPGKISTSVSSCLTLVMVETVSTLTAPSAANVQPDTFSTARANAASVSPTTCVV